MDEMISDIETQLEYVRSKSHCFDPSVPWYQWLFSKDPNCTHSNIGRGNHLHLQEIGMAIFVLHKKLLLPILRNLSCNDTEFALKLIRCVQGVFTYGETMFAVFPRTDDELNKWDPQVDIQSTQPDAIIEGLRSFLASPNNLLLSDRLAKAFARDFGKVSTI